MSIQSLFSFFHRPKCDAEYITNLCGAAGLYALAGTALSLASPWSAAAYSLTTILSTRAALWALNKYPCDPSDLTAKIAVFVSSFFAGSVMGAFLTSSMGLPMSFATGMLLHGAILSTVLIVTAVALACLLGIGACISVRSLPE